jgi:hypothetical protein
MLRLKLVAIVGAPGGSDDRGTRLAGEKVVRMVLSAKEENMVWLRLGDVDAVLALSDWAVITTGLLRVCLSMLSGSSSGVVHFSRGSYFPSPTVYPKAATVCYRIEPVLLHASTLQVDPT